MVRSVFVSQERDHAPGQPGDSGLYAFAACKNGFFKYMKPKEEVLLDFI